MRKSLAASIGVLLLLAPAAAWALRYMPLDEAVRQFLPSDAKVEQVEKTLTAAQKKRLADDYGLVDMKDSYRFYLGKDPGGKVLAYVVLLDEQFNTCFHKFAIGMKPDGEVIDVAIVELSCPRAMPINKRSFLKQFAGKKHTDPLTIRADIDGITGATLSSEAASIATRRAVALHHLWFGGARPVHPSAAVQKARREGKAEIDRAIQTAPWAQPGGE